jgi:hypothetical protein
MKSIILSSALVLALGGSVLAQTPKTFTDVDTDTNGELSLAELQVVWPDMTEAEFGPADSDTSGGLSIEEVNILQAAAAPTAPTAPVAPAAPAVPMEPTPAPQ